MPWSEQKPQEHCAECWLGYKQGSPEASGCLEHRDEIILPDPQKQGSDKCSSFLGRGNVEPEAQSHPAAESLGGS